MAEYISNPVTLRAEPVANIRKEQRHNAYHTLLPVLVVEHYRRLVALALKSRHDLVGILGHLLVDVLALVVVAVDVLSLLQRMRKILFHE